MVQSLAFLLLYLTWEALKEYRCLGSSTCLLNQNLWESRFLKFSPVIWVQLLHWPLFRG